MSVRAHEMDRRSVLRIIAEDTEKRPAPCADCGKETEPRTKVGRPLFQQFDCYLVRDEVWAEAGMGDWSPRDGETTHTGWFSGFLCTSCLQTRLGRALTDADYLMKPLRATGSYLEASYAPEYMDRILNGRGY